MEVNINQENIIIKSDNSELIMYKTVDEDIMVISSKSKTIQKFDMNSIDINEVKLYNAFSKLMNSIVGKYVLDERKEFLPDDFVNPRLKVIKMYNSKNMIKFQKINDCIVLTMENHNSYLSKNNGLNYAKVCISKRDNTYLDYNNEFYALFDNMLYTDIDKKQKTFVKKSFIAY